MFYKALLEDVVAARRGFVAERLLALRAALAAEVPAKVLGDSIRIATFNIRELGSDGKGGRRLPESLLYLAEILNRFDLIAVQEVRALDDLRALMNSLGSWWKVIHTDVTEGASGNRERLTFLYDSRAVVPTGLAGEIVLPRKKGAADVLQYARTPYVCGFKAGWKSFELCTVHIYYGEGKPDDPRRLAEIQSLTKLLEARAVAEKKASAKNGSSGRPSHKVVLGDFNIFGHDDQSYAALLAAKFEVPKALQTIPGSNVERNKRYDQVAFYQGDHALTVTRAGVFDFFQHVYRMPKGGGADDAPHYPEAKGKFKSFKEWRTFQMSDHLVMWVELKIDAADEWLKRVK